MKFLVLILGLISLSAYSKVTHRTVSLKPENCHSVPAEFVEKGVDTQDFCGTVDEVSFNYVTKGEGTYLILIDSLNDSKRLKLIPSQPIFGGSPYVVDTSVDTTLINGSLVGVAFLGNGNSNLSRLVAVRINRKKGTTCVLGTFKKKADARKAIIQGKCK